MTAYKLLNTFVDLNPGDWVTQNAANSSVNIRSIHSMSVCDLNSTLGEIDGSSSNPVGQGSWDPHYQLGPQKVSARNMH